MDPDSDIDEYLDDYMWRLGFVKQTEEDGHVTYVRRTALPKMEPIT